MAPKSPLVSLTASLGGILAAGVFFFSSFFFLQLYLWPMEVPGRGVIVVSVSKGGNLKFRQGGLAQTVLAPRLPQLSRGHHLVPFE